MSPEPDRVGQGILEERDSCIQAEYECARILYRAVEGAKERFGGNPTVLAGLLLDEDCVHPLVTEIVQSPKIETTYTVVLGGKEFGRLFSISITGDDGKEMGVHWGIKGKREEVYPIYRNGSGFLIQDALSLSLKISTEKKVGRIAKGVIFFPERMVKQGCSPQRMLELSTVVANHASFVPVHEGLKRAAGLR